MQIGKAIRLERIFNRNTNRTIIVPLDHGVSVGPIFGLTDMKKTVGSIVEGGANAVLMHKGLVRCGHRTQGKDIGLVVHLSASTNLSPFPGAKTLVCTVEEAIMLGADAVSLHINLGDEAEASMLGHLGEVSKAASAWGIPVLAMIYGRGPKIANEFDPEIVAHCARVGVELGADVVKVPYTGNPDSFSKVVDGSCIPVVIAGGPKTPDTKSFLKMVEESVQAGGAGLSVGRNIFQHNDPKTLLEALNLIVHGEVTTDEALAQVGDL